MNDEMRELKKKYKAMVQMPEKTPDELESYLNHIAKVRRIDKATLDAGSQGICCAAYVHSLILEGRSANELEWAAYELENNRENEKYYNDMLTELPGETIIVVFEKKTGWITSNCQLLLLELLVERGVSKFDYDHETSNLNCYLTYLDGYFRRCRNKCETI